MQALNINKGSFPYLWLIIAFMIVIHFYQEYVQKQND